LKKNIITTLFSVGYLQFHTKLGGPTEKQGTQKKDRLGWAMGIGFDSVTSHNIDSITHDDVLVF
jgi:hypothetical protein